MTVPALGYTTIVLRQREPETYPVYLKDGPFMRMTGNFVGRFYDHLVLDNGVVKAVIDGKNGRVKSLVDLESGAEMIKEGETAGFEYLETECRSSSAWSIGRTLRDIPVDKCVELSQTARGALRQSVKATYSLEGGCRTPSMIEVTYSLEAGSRALKAEIKVDWQEQGSDIIPVLAWKTPLEQLTGKFRYIIPEGTRVRPALNDDVPGIGGGAALRADGRALTLVSDSKYGYRGEEDSLTLTLINSSVSPDPYPERGIHHITIWLGIGSGEAQDLQCLTDEMNHKLMYQPSNVHSGDLPACWGLAQLVSGTVAITSVQAQDGALMIRGYETAGKDGEARVKLSVAAKAACLTDLSERGAIGEARVEGDEVVFPVKGSGIWAIKATL